MRKQLSLLLVSISLGWVGCAPDKQAVPIHLDRQLEYCDAEIRRTLNEADQDSCLMPRSMEANQTSWNMSNTYVWTSGFWPGILWYDYEATGNEEIKAQAICYTECLFPLVTSAHSADHDIGFQIFCSFGNAYRMTGNQEYKAAILKGAEKLAKLYNPKVGTILSWPGMVKRMGWPHNTIMDNMMNLEILFWAARNGGRQELYDMAVKHAETTMKYSFREDGGNYHVAVYDTIDGHFIKGVTNQGYGDSSLWARGQAWAIYGYMMVYRETKDKTFLRFAEKVTDFYLENLPEDYIPYWDFDAPDMMKQPKDASAAAIAASALIELSELEDTPSLASRYWNAAVRMLEELSSERYQCRDAKPAFLMHSTGNHPGGYEIDASINYADYYYLQALLKYKKAKGVMANSK